MSLRFKPKKATIWWKDRRRWESLNILPTQVWPVGEKAEELIKQGLRTVNGQVVRELATTIKSGDKVEVEGQPIYNEEKVYYLLNKPRGVSFPVDRWQGSQDGCRPLAQCQRAHLPCGSFDWDTSGVLILTNDGILRMRWFTLVMRLIRSMSRVKGGQ